jgi:hypothetical protein
MQQFMRLVLAVLLLAFGARVDADKSPRELTGVAEVGVGLGFACARTDTGSVFCWGESAQGHLGRVTRAHIPVEIPLPAPARRLWVLGDFPVCAELARDGSLWCWGRREPTPILQRGLEQSPGIVELARSVVMRCALLRDGSVRCAGHRSVAESGFSPLIGSEVAGQPYVALSGLGDVVQLGLTNEFACARTREGAVRCWGRNNLGQLGGSSARTSAVPVTPRGLDRDVSDLAVLGDGACVIVTGGSVRCWGEVGIENPMRFGRTPTALKLPAPATRLYGWINGVDALLADGTLATWGYSKLSDGKSRYVRRPTRVDGVVGATQVTGVDTHYALTPAGWLCWGDCAAVWNPIPVGPSGLPPEASAPARSPASAFTCAVRTGQVLCRGYNDKGQLGDGSKVDHLTDWVRVTAPAPPAP